MAEQLTLHLEPSLPRPAQIAPMWPTPWPEPFDSAAHLFEPSWGGTRAIAFIGPGDRPGAGAVRLVDPDGRDLVTALPELAGLAVRVAARSAVLDGELVVVDARGRADPAALAERLAGRPGPPVAYLVFDVLHVDGRSLLGVSLASRRTALRRILRPGDEAVVVPAIAGEGRALHDAVRAQGISGVLARERSSPYLPGVRSRLWRRVAATATATAEPHGPGSSAVPAGDGPEADASGTGPVLALFRRLPLEEPEP